MPPGGEPLDPALILDDWINRVANLPEEIRFLQDEIADRDAKYNECIKIIEERDARLQKFIKTNGSHEPNPREEGYRKTIVENYDKAEKLADEKIQLAQRMQAAMDRHVRQLDMQLKQLYDRSEPGFTDPDELPSLLRPNSAHPSTPSIRPSAISSSNGGYHGSMNGTHRESTPAAVHAAATVAVNGGSTPSGSGRGASHVANRQAHTQQGHSSSAPASPAASMILGRQTREGSAGPGGPGKRGPRINSSLSNIPTTSSGLARHSSLGPGTPKSHQAAQGIQRAGSAGPRATTKGTGLGLGRKSGTPSASSSLVAAAAGVVAGSGPGRKKGNGANGGPASKTLSRVKRPAKHSAASSTAESELSEADSASDSNASSRRGTPVRSSSHGGGGPGGGPGAAGGGSNGNAGGTGGGGGGEKEGSSQPQMKRERDSLGGMPGVSGAGGGSGAGSTAGAGGHGTGPGSGGGHGGTGGAGGAALTKHAPRGAGGMAPSSDDRMDVDDDEAGDDRKYCLCQNVSFGDMVACDNDDCPFEWFHWSCVGLKSEPNGAWFCPVCTEKMKGSGNGPGNGGGVPATTRKAK